MAVQTSAVKVGESCSAVVVEDLTRTQIVQYAGASGDFNPLHSDERFAREVAGHPGVFAHGMLTMGLGARVITDWFGVESLLSFGVQFRAQVWPGDTLTATAVVASIADSDDGPVAELELTVVNQADVAVVRGRASVRLDG
jgi:acyl dehydratase